jgi:serine protease AprX
MGDTKDDRRPGDVRIEGTSGFTINGIRFDPADPADHERWPDSDSRYALVQTDGPPDAAGWKALADAGFEVHEHVGGNTYLGAYPGRDLETLLGTGSVTWVGRYPMEAKIAPSLRDTEEARSPAYRRSPLSIGPNREVDVVLHADVDPTSSDVRSRVARAAGIDEARLQAGVHKFRVVVDASNLEEIAAIDEVRQIEEIFASGVGNNVAGQIIHAGVVVNGTTYEGDGEIIAIADTGFDKGSTINVHAAFTNRVERLYDLGRSGMFNDPDGHGTHVAGSALGDGTSSSMGGAIRGTAPQARLVLQSMLDSTGGLGGIPADLHDLFQPPYDNETARVHSNSWGMLDPSLAYNTRSTEIDDFAWTHQDLVILFLAGNSGTDADSNGAVEDGQIGAEAASKNAITVGASESNRGSATWKMGTYVDPRRPTVKFLADPIKNDIPCNDASGMAAFSSRGPTREGRYKPDVVAPGTCILSAKSRDLPATTTNSWGTSSDNLYWFDAGTSMATPLVAGCAAVLRETLVKNGWNAPPSALIKALLINGAVELRGQFSPSEAGPSPNNHSGWGLVDLAGSVIIPGPNGDAGLGTGGPIQESGQEDHFTVHVPGSTFKMTLVWTDPPGAALQNDLDLIVRASNGEERHGNMGTQTELFDRVNNVEQIYWEHVPSGDLDIVISAHRIMPGYPQSYAWVWRLWS